MEHEAFGYQWVRKSTGEFYRGVHRGNPDDNYAGSGVVFVKKFGGIYKSQCVNTDDWVRDVLFLGTYDECLLWESLVVTERVLEDSSCLNLALGGGRGFMGLSHTEKAKNKMSKAKTGKPLSQEVRQKLSHMRKGAKKTDEHRKNLSTSLAGKPKTDEHIKKLSEAGMGHRQSEESKRKKSDSMKAYWARRKEAAIEGEVDVKQQ